MSNPQQGSSSLDDDALPDDQTMAAERERGLLRLCANIWRRWNPGKNPTAAICWRTHPDIATELSACLAGLSFVNSAAAGLESAVGSAVLAHRSGRSGQRSTAGRFQAGAQIGPGRHGRGVRGVADIA